MKKVGIKKIFITVNYARQYEAVKKIFANDKSILVVRNRFRKTTAYCVAPALRLLGNRFIFAYGHSPAPPSHLRNLISISRRGVVVSVYPSTTQKLEKRKLVSFTRRRVVLSDLGSFYIEPPYILTSDFVKILAKSESWRQAFLRYFKPLVAIKAKHPPEFNYYSDFMRFKRFILDFIRRHKG